MEDYRFTKKAEPYPTWVYHKTLEPKIIPSDKLESHLNEGWADSPFGLCKVEDFGVDPKNEVHVQELGETIQGITDSLNGQLNLDNMTKKELIYYADKHLELDIDSGKQKKAVLMLIKKKLDDTPEARQDKS